MGFDPKLTDSWFFHPYLLSIFIFSFWKMTFFPKQCFRSTFNASIFVSVLFCCQKKKKKKSNSKWNTIPFRSSEEQQIRSLVSSISSLNLVFDSQNGRSWQNIKFRSVSRKWISTLRCLAVRNVAGTLFRVTDLNKWIGRYPKLNQMIHKWIGWST